VPQPLTPWVDLYTVLKIYAPELIDPETGEITGDPADVAEWQACIDSASWMMWALAAGKVHPSECWIEDYSLIGSCEVNLLNQPILAVDRAELVESCPHQDAGTPIDFCVDFQRVNFCCSGAVLGMSGSGGYSGVSCGCRGRWVRIFYRTESTLPPGTQGRVAWFADQCHKAMTGDKNCSLPERIQNISRQGVSWSVLDPMDFLDKKLTGIGRLDSWLTTVRLQYPASQLIDPLRSQRRSSKLADCCGPEFEGHHPEPYVAAAPEFATE
jgi:hypothetical protein